MAKPSETITMSMREVDRLKTIQAVEHRRLRIGQAAERLGMTARQVECLIARYRAEGPQGLVSRQRGCPSNHQLDEELVQHVLELIQQYYPDFGPTLAREKLMERHGITLAKETVRKLMTATGLWRPRRQRPPKVYQPPSAYAWLGATPPVDRSA
jgi:transposase